jgi:RepB plasmid partitioning protein/ParB-like nuclease domain
VTDGNDDTGVKFAFERESIVVAISQLVPLKTLRPGTKESKKYAQIVRSVRAIGLVEPPVVALDPKRPGTYFLVDGHLRIEVLKDLGVTEVECLVSTDDETYTYNKRINRLVPVQEHRMIMRAVERGVPEDQIAEALGLEVTSVRRRSRMLDGICPDAIELLKESPCALAVFDILRQMTPIRQVEAADLMVGQSNFTAMFAKALLVATPERQLVEPRKRKPDGASTITSEQIARMERELASLQSQVKSVEDTYGVDNLHLTVAKGYVAKLLANTRVERWLAQSRPEYLTEFQAVAEIETIGTAKIAAE